MPSILLIEDDELFRTALAAALVKRGFSVREAADGRDGVKQFRAAPADIVVTDIVMPDQDGTTTIAELRRDFPRLGIIAMSGGLAHHAPLYLKIAAAFGAQRTLQKPFHPAALFGAIDELLAARSAARPGADLPD